MSWDGPKLKVWSPLATALSIRGVQPDGMEQLRPGRRRAQVVVFDPAYFLNREGRRLGRRKCAPDDLERSTLPKWPVHLDNFGEADKHVHAGQNRREGVREDFVKVLRRLRYADFLEKRSMRRIRALFRAQNRSLNGRRSTSCVQAERGCRWMCQ